MNARCGVTKCWIVWKFFFFLDCLRRTKGYELLILEYQNVVGTKVGCTIIFIAARCAGALCMHSYFLPHIAKVK